MATSQGDSSSALVCKCKKCKNTAISGLKCITCGNISHNSCVKLLKNVKIIDDVHFDCCQNDNVDLDTSFCSANESDFSASAESLKMEISYLKQLIKSKDIIINTQLDLINSLKLQIKLTDNINLNVKQVEPSVDKIPNVQNVQKSANFSQQTKHSVPNTSESVNTATVKVNDSLVKNNKQVKSDANKLNKNISNSKNTNINKKYDRSSKKTIIGNLTANSNLSLKVAENRTFIHIYKLHPDTTVEEVTRYLRQRFAEADCEKLDSKYPKYYSSFKASIYSYNLKAALDPELWPQGAHVNKFFLLQKQGHSIPNNTSGKQG